MVYDVVNMWIRHGRRVISNTPIWCWIKGRLVKCEFYPDPEEYEWNFFRAKHAAVVCDESSLYFSSVRWSHLSLDWFAKFRQAGKQSCDLLCTSQSWNDTVSALRRIADRATVCNKKRWIIPFGIDLRRDKYNEKRKCYEYKGLQFGTPLVYHMKTVLPGWFASKAMLPENRRRYELKHRVLFPSDFWEYSQCYDHEYQITGSAVGKLKHFGTEHDGFKTFGEWKAAQTKAPRSVRGGDSPSAEVDDSARPVARTSQLNG